MRLVNPIGKKGLKPLAVKKNTDVNRHAQFDET